MSSRIEQFVPLKKIGTVISPKVSGDSLKINTIDEETTDSGVTIEGVLLKDGLTDGVDVAALENDVNYPSTVKQKAITDTGEDGGVEGGIFNGDFEYGSGTVTDDGWVGAEKYGWYADRDATAISVSYDNGKLKLSNTDGTGSSSVKNVSAVTLVELSKNASPMIVSTKYRLSCKVKTTNAATDAVFLSMIQYDSAAVSGTTITLTKVTGDTDETYYESIFTSDADATYAVFEYHNDVAGNISDAWFDDIKLEQIDAQTINAQMDEIVSVSVEGVTTTDNVTYSNIGHSTETTVGQAASEKRAIDLYAYDENISGISFYKKANGGTFVGDVTFEIYETTSETGDITGSALSSYFMTNAIYNALSVNASHFIDLPCKLDSTKYYALVITTSTSDDVNYMQVGCDVYTAGSVRDRVWNGSAWVDSGRMSEVQLHFAKHTESPIIEANGSKLDLTGVKLLTGAKVTVNADGSGRYVWDEQITDAGLTAIHDLDFTTVNNFDITTAASLAGNADNILIWKYDFAYPVDSIRVLTQIREGTTRSGNIYYSFDNVTFVLLYTGDTAGGDADSAALEFIIDGDNNTELYLKFDMNYISADWLINYITVDANLNCQAELPIFAPSSEVSSETEDLVLDPIDISEDGFWQLKYDLTGWGSRTISMIADEATWEAQAVSANYIYIYDSNGTDAWTWDERNGLVPPADRISGAVMAKFLVGDNQIKSSVNDGSMKANVNLSWTESSIRSSLNYVKDKVNSLLDLTRLKILNVWGQKSVTYDGSNPPAAGLVNGVPVMDFDAATDEIIYMADIHLPSDYDPATDLKVYGTFVMASATSGDVVLDLEYMTVGANENITSTSWTNLTSTVTVPSTAGFRAGVSFTIPSQDFDASSDTLVLKLFRDTSEDSAAGDLRLIKLYLIYDGEVI